MTKSELILKIGELNPHLYQRDVETHRLHHLATRFRRRWPAATGSSCAAFGAFSVKQRQCPLGAQSRAPATPSRSSARRCRFFKTGKQLRDRLNDKE